MLVKKEVSLNNFEFWSGARDRVKYLTYDDLDTLERFLEDIFDGIPSETEVNDIFWFEEDFIAEMLGYDDWEALESEREDGDLDE